MGGKMTWSKMTDEKGGRLDGRILMLSSHSLEMLPIHVLCMVGYEELDVESDVCEGAGVMGFVVHNCCLSKKL